MITSPEPQTLDPFGEAYRWVLEHCTATDAIRTRCSPPPEGFRFGSFDGLVAECGRAMRPLQKPDRLAWGTPRYCFHNVHKIVARSKRWLYAEGMAATDRMPFPFLHAWLVDAETGTAHEVTIPDVLPLAYVGFVFTREYSVSAYRRGSREGVVSLIDAWKARWPLLRMSPEELSAITLNPEELCRRSTA